MVYLRYILIIPFLLVGGVLCEDLPLRAEKLLPKGEDTIITLTAEDKDASALILYSEVTENISSLGEMFLNASVPLKGIIEYKKTKGRGRISRFEASSTKGWIRIDVDINGSPSRVIGEGAYARTFFSFDSCDLKARYLVRIVIDLSEIPDEVFDSGIVVHGAFRIVPYDGFKGASLKAMGEGRYKSPLLLVSSISGGEAVRLVKWRGAKIAEHQIIPFPDYVSYRGQTLARVPLGKEILRGGAGVFELIVPGAWIGYSTCFELWPRRQYSGGYRR